MFVRYSTNSFTSSNLVQAAFSGTSGVAQIPAQTAGATVAYYVFSSNKTSTQINSDNSTYSTALGYDMATLRLNNNGGSNYSYAVNAAVAGNVLVQSSGGTTTITAYTTVGFAFAAINAGTHTGAISVFLNAATITENSTLGSFLLTSGTGLSSYTSVLVQPILDAVTVTGVVTNGNGIVGLIGASNVTIDGDNPNTTGTNRNLTIANTTTAANSTAIRIAGVITPPTTATNDIVRNCTITAANATSTNYGIYAGTDAATAASTTAGTTTTGTGKYASLTFTNNLIQTAGRAIYVAGASGSEATGISITNNTIGSATAGNLTAAGIVLSFATAPTISGNNIRNLTTNSTTATDGSAVYLVSCSSPVVSGNTISGIVSSGSTTAAGVTVDAGVTTPSISGNVITGIQNTSASGYSAIGIQVRNSSPCTIVNNSISAINAYFNNTNTGTTYGVFGIRLASTGSNVAHKVYYNSIYLSGSPVGGSTSTEHTSCLLVVDGGTTQTGMDIRNNILANFFSGTSALHTAISLPSGLTSSFNLTLNNNAYYAPITTGNYIALAISAGTTYTAANFNAAATSPVANLRAYTSTLSSAGTNDNRSFASSATPPFTSTTSLVIPASTTTAVESGAAYTATVLTDITGATRATGSTFPPTAANTNPDMGAYEGSYTLPAPIAVTGSAYTQTSTNTAANATNQLVTSLTVSTSGNIAGLTLTSATFTLGGSANTGDVQNAKLYVNSTNTFTGATLIGTLATVTSPSFTVPATTPQTLTTGTNYFFLSYDIKSGATVNNTVAAVPTTLTFSSGTSTPTGTPGTTRPILGPLNGLYTVGTGSTYLTITAAIADLTLRGVSGPVTFSLTNTGAGNAYSTTNANPETFPLNVTAYAGFSSTNTVTFKPAIGTSPVISNGSAVALFKLTDVSYVIIDGSNTVGGTTRDLSLTNTSTGTNTALVWIATSGGTLSNNNKVLNTVMQGGVNTSVSASTGVMVSSTIYNSVGADNDNHTISNNTIQGTYSGIICGGTAAVSAGGLDGLTITNNVVGPGTAAAANNIVLYGIFVQGAVSPSVTGNTVQNVVNTSGSAYGIDLSNVIVGITGATASTNTITNISGSADSYGLYSTASSLTATGNTISTVSSTGGIPYGMSLTGATNTITANTITGVTTAAAFDAVGMNLGTGFTGGVVDRNKILNVTATNSGGYGGRGIDVNTGSATSNLRISNNFVAGINGSGWSSFALDAIIGIRLTGTTGGVSLYYNSVNLSGNYSVSSASTYQSAALFVASTVTALDVRNNIFSNSLVNTSGTASKAYAFYSAAAKTAYTTINYNDYYTGGASQAFLGNLGGTGSSVGTTGDMINLAAFKATTGTGQDVNSLNIDPTFTSATDLHTINSALAAGTAISGVTVDIDGETRNTPPYIGADEIPVVAVDIAAVALLTPAVSSCYSTAETVSVTVRNASTVAALDFTLNPLTVTVTVTVTGAVSQIFTITINNNTGNPGSTPLGTNVTRTVTLPGSLNMSMAGTYTFAVNATVSGDQNSLNNDVSPSPIRTVVTPTAGSASAATTTICGASGTTSLTATGASGSVVTWYSSADGFTAAIGTGSPYVATVTAPASVTFKYKVVCATTSSFSTATATVTAANPTITGTNTPVTRCGAGSVTLTATASAGTPFYYTVATGGTALGSGASQVVTVTATPATQTFYVAAQSGSCASAPRTAITVNVTTPPTLSYTGTLSYCAGGSTVLTFAPTTYTSLSIAPTTNATVSGSTITFTGASAGTTAYTVSANDGTGAAGCSTTLPVSITVNPVPNAPTYTGTTTVCASSSTTLTFTPATASSTILSVASFEAGANGFTTIPTSPTAPTSGFFRQTGTYSLGTGSTSYTGPNAAGSYYVADSDKGASSFTTVLVSPAFSTVGYSAATISAQQFFRYTGFEVAGIDYTTDGGTNWFVLTNYAATVGIVSGVQSYSTYSLPTATIGKANVQFRFYYSASNDYYWAIDNVSVTGVPISPVYAVTPTTNATVTGNTISFNPTTTTNYSVTVATNGVACPSPATLVTITINPLPTFTVAQTNVTCNGANNGAITVTAAAGTGTYEYSINGGGAYQSANTFTGLTPGGSPYSVLVRNLGGTQCPAAASQSVTITQPVVLSFTGATATAATCNNSSTGQLVFNGTTGGTGAYSYLYSTNGGSSFTASASATVTGLPAGSYTLKVRDANSCETAPIAANIINPPALVASATPTNATCSNGSDGSIDASATSGGTAPYGFRLGTSGAYANTSGSFTGLAPGTYTIGVKDANGCTASTTATVGSTNTAPTAMLTNSGPVCNGSSAMVNVALTGTGPWTFTYTDGTTPTTVTAASTTPYIITTAALSANVTYSLTALSGGGGCAASTLPSTTTVTVNTTATWTGANSDDWFDGGNWSNGCVPNRSIDANVPGSVASGKYPALSTTATAAVRTLTIATGASLGQSAGTLNVYGNLSNSGIITPTGGMIALLGSSPTMTGMSTLYALEVNLSSGTVALSNAISIRNQLTMTQGVLNTNGYLLTLLTGSTLSETNNSYLLGTVSVPGRTLTAGTAEPFSGIGLVLTPAMGSASPGITSVVRTTGTALTGVSNSGGTSVSIKRYFDIQPTVNTGLNVTMNFSYLDHERNGIASANLALFRSVTTTAGPWSNQSPITSVGYTLTKTGIADFSIWTLGNGITSPLPVELTRFEAIRRDTDAELTWATASEKNNAGFKVQVSTDGRAFRTLHTVEPASANSMAPRNYGYTDREAGKTGLRYYRLGQLDLNGTASFSPVRTVRFGDAAAAMHLTAAPNPFQDHLTLSVELPANAVAASAHLTLSDVAGRRLLTQRTAVLSAGMNLLELPDLARLPSGVYIVHLAVPGQAAQRLKVVKE